MSIILLLGFQYEYQNASKWFYAGWKRLLCIFINGEFYDRTAKPSAFGITHSNSADLSQFKSELAFQQFSVYLQDQINVSDNFRLTAGLRFELPKLSFY
jgi:outer membrane receptor protein involved in Fe transport